MWYFQRLCQRRRVFRESVAELFPHWLDLLLPSDLKKPSKRVQYKTLIINQIAKIPVSKTEGEKQGKYSVSSIYIARLQDRGGPGDGTRRI